MYSQPAQHSQWIALLRERAERRGDERAFTYLDDGAATEHTWTYGELDERVRAIATELQRQLRPGDRALLLYPPGLDFIAGFFACLFAGVIAVPVYPPRDRATLDKLLAIANDAGASYALTTRAVLARTRMQRWFVSGLRALRWIATDEVPSESAGEWSAPSLSQDAIAFLQYTSGSTGTPKGVMVSHGNLVHNARMIEVAWTKGMRELAGGAPFVSWLPMYHDMGLIGKVLVPLWLGSATVFVSPLGFLQQPYRWLAAISRHRAVVSAAPNFAYDLCVRKVTAAQRDTLDLSTWLVALNGAEPVRSQTMQRFSDWFRPAGFRSEAFYPSYGLAECTLFVTGGIGLAGPTWLDVERDSLERGRVVPRAEGPDTTRVVGCGTTWLDQDVRIVDPALHQELAPGLVGEIWISSPSVAKGYWGNEEASTRELEARLVTNDGAEAGPFLRTGDLGFVYEGTLFITGRSKDLIIVRGRNLYPQDIELTVEHAHPSLRPGGGAAFSIEVDSEERLIVVHEIDRRAQPPDGHDVVCAIREAVVREHAVSVHDVRLLEHGGLAKTSSGKVRRRQCRADYLADELTCWTAHPR